jgi:hypothetical protein
MSVLISPRRPTLADWTNGRTDQQHRAVVPWRQAGYGERVMPGLHADHDLERIAGDQEALRRAFAKSRFTIEQVGVWIVCQHLVDRRGNYVSALRAIGEKQGVTLVGSEGHAVEDTPQGGVERWHNRAKLNRFSANHSMSVGRRCKFFFYVLIYQTRLYLSGRVL